MTHVQKDMEPCHSVVSSRSPAYTSAATVAHLIRNIEQLKNKDKLISQLEKDLGHQWAAVQLAALERTPSEGAEAMASPAPSLPPGALPDDRTAPDSFSWTPTSVPVLGDVEEERSTGDEGFVCGKQDMPTKKLKERNKELAEKCRAYLQRTKELTAQNRAFKDISDRALQENKKLQELLEHSKLRLLQVSRQVNDLKSERSNVDKQSEGLEDMKKEMIEDKKAINALKQACSEKDRRIELIQHRKKRRRLMESTEKNMGVRETFFGYEEDNQSVDSENNSTSSLSFSTVSEDDLWDDVLGREEMERNYQRLAMEQLQLQKSYALLQSHMGRLQDPQREALSRSHAEHDLFQAQCRIEHLEKLVNEIGEGEVISLLKEREAILDQNKVFYEKIQAMEGENRQLSKTLAESQENFEELEFRLVELEHLEEEMNLNSTCQTSSEQCQPAPGTNDLVEQLGEREQQQRAASAEMDDLRRELARQLSGKGRDADAVLQRMDRMWEMERKNSSSLESMAHELQMKIISLQKENDSLQDELAARGVKSVQGDRATVAAKERLENLELKVQLDRLIQSESKLCGEKNGLQEELDECKSNDKTVRHQLDLVTWKQQQVHVKTKHYPSSGESSPDSSPSSKRSSKDRKSKSRGEDDFTPQSKRRKSNKQKDNENTLRAFSSFDDIELVSEEVCLSKTFRSTENIQPVKSSNSVDENMMKRISKLEAELKDMKNENTNLTDQLKQSVLEKSSEAEADQQILLDQVRAMDSELYLLRQENEALASKLRRYQEDYHGSQEEISPRLSELEDYCEDLQERLQSSETSERHLKEKHRFLESSIYDAESSEMVLREEYEKLVAKEAEAKKHIHELKRTGRELRDIILDKDIVEHALRDKVDFLQKAEAASVQRIDELEAIERELREQLEQSSGEGSSSLRDQNKIQELKHQLTFLETDNRALSARVSELEENEEILRENWRRVADEDYNRTQCLEEKVRIMETMNRDLRSKLSDAQEYYVINTLPGAETSLAAELAQSQTSAARIYHSPDSLSDTQSQDESDGENEDVSQLHTEQKTLKDKVWKLERKLSDVSELKNSKIETLQEKIVSLKENEIKLSETISEMEMTEREIRAKLALYESSEVTVEKMLKYQSKIEELRTSQESLLDQLESQEMKEMTMQEQIQEMERTLRGKIVTLEVEMKGCKQKELKTAGRNRELEKQEKELTEKLAQQAEKENGLYIKISSLMDELKAAKGENETLKTQLSEKEDKVRKSKLLEVQLLEIEMEFGKKSSDLSSRLRHKEEQLRQREVAHDEELKSLREELSQNSSEQSQRVSILEKMFDQKEKELRSTISTLEESLKAVTCERDEKETEVKLLTEAHESVKNSHMEYERDLEFLAQEVESVKTNRVITESQMKENIDKETERAYNAENRVRCLEDEIQVEKQNIREMESKRINMKDDIERKMKTSKDEFCEKEGKYEKEIETLKDELNLKDSTVKELEKEVNRMNEHVRELEAECKRVKREAAAGEHCIKQRVLMLEQSMSDKENALAELKREHEEELKALREQSDHYESQLLEAKKSNDNQNDQLEKLTLVCNMKDEGITSMESEVTQIKQMLEEKSSELDEYKETFSNKHKEYNEQISVMKSHEEMLEKELRNKVMFLNTQLLQEAAAREAQQTSIEEHEDRETGLFTQVEHLKKEVAQHKYELLEKLSELEVKNKESCGLSLELSQCRHSLKTLQHEFDNSRQNWSIAENNLQKQLIEKDQTIETTNNDLKNFKIQFYEIESRLEEKEADLAEIKSKKEFMEQSLSEKEKLVEEKCQKEIEIHEKIQRNEMMLQESGREKQAHETELCRLREEIGDKVSLLNKSDANRRELKQKTESLGKRISELETELSQAGEKLKEQTTKIKEKVEKEKSKETEVKTLQQKLDETFKEANEKDLASSASHSEILSKMSSKEQELVCAQKELQKCLQDIEQCKIECFKKEQELNQRDQNCKELLEEKHKLTMQLEHHDQETKSYKSEVEAVQSKLVEAENRYLELEAKCASLELQLEERYASAQKAEDILFAKDKELQDLNNELSLLVKDYTSVCSDLKKIQEEYKDLESQQVSSEMNCSESLANFAKKDEECKKLEDDLNRLTDFAEESKLTEEKLLVSISECEKLECKIAEIETLLNEKDKECEFLKSSLQESEDQMLRFLNVEDHFRELQEKYAESDRVVVDLQKEIESNKCSMEDALRKMAEKCAECESLNAKLSAAEKDIHTNESSVTDLSNRLDSAQTKLHEFEVENDEQNKTLRDQIELMEAKLIKKEEMCRSVETNLVETRAECEKLQLSKNQSESEVSALNEELIEAANEMENLRKSFDELQSNLKEQYQKRELGEKKIAELLRELEENKESYRTLQSELDELKETLKEHDKALNVSKSRVNSLERDVKVLTSEKDAVSMKCKSLMGENESLLMNLSETSREAEHNIECLKKEIHTLKVEKEESIISPSEYYKNDSPVVKESGIIVSQVNNLQDSCLPDDDDGSSQMPIYTDEVVLDDSDICVSIVDNSSVSYDDGVMNENGLEKEKQIEVLISEISAYKYRDDVYQEKLQNLKTSLKEMNEREAKSVSRVDLLETSEKELLEQMADIEQTVIVPLESENQELKDELSVVKQERDQALNRINHVDETGEEDVESIRKSLEDALLKKEELEKKVDILSQDIVCFESERGALFQKVSDLEFEKTENDEKLEGLQVELGRLQNVEMQTTVVEETENRLMDRVLELEEREQYLLAEVEQLQKSHGKKKTSDADLQQLKYLKEKNQVLQDAEGKYMDKIMELEEIEYRLRSELSLTKSNAEPEQSKLLTESESHSTMMSQSQCQSLSQVLGDNPKLLLIDVSVDTSDIPDYSESSETYEPSLPESKNSNLESDLDDKQKTIDSLHEKLVLLQDSEARLMEKLLDVEAKSDDSFTRNADSDKKIETLMEENEFLAENVENYKKLYKEEKQKVNDLHDKLLEENTITQELQETHSELESTQSMMEELQSEYEEHLKAKEVEVEELKEEILMLKKKSEDQDKQDKSDLIDKSAFLELEEKVHLLMKENEKLQKTIESQNQVEEDLRAQDKLRRQELQGQIDALAQRRDEQRLQYKEQEQKLQAELDTLMQREQTTLKKLEAQHIELRELRQSLASQEKQREEDQQADSGIYADDIRLRSENTDSLNRPSAPVTQEVYSSTATVLLSRPPASPTPVSSVKKLALAYSNRTSSSDPVAPPRSHRKAKSRTSSVDSTASCDELSPLEAESVHPSTERRAWTAEHQPLPSNRDTRDGDVRLRVARVNRRLGELEEENTEDVLNQSRELDRSFGSVTSWTSGAMLDKPEDVLHQRIKELERLDAHNKNQLSELERDREVLHEIARKDKTTIHELNVKIRELQLSERSLKEQVGSLEAAESSLFARNEELEAIKSKQEDRIHELGVHERRLRELVRKFKLDEEHWLSKSGGMETAVAELSANEHQLKRLLQDVELERGGLTERAEYQEARIRELENVEVNLLQRIKNYENNEVTLQNQLVHLENSETASHSKASELDMINIDLSQRLQKAIEENAVMSQHATQLHGQVQDLDRRLMSSRDSELAYKQHVESLQKNESSLQKKVREYELREIDSQARIRELEQTAEITNDKLATLQRSENKLKYRVQELEGIGGQIPGELTPAQRQKVPHKLEDCQKRVLVLQTQVENLQLQLRQALSVTHKQDNSQEEDERLVSVEKDDYNKLQTKAALLDETTYQLEEVEKLNEDLNAIILQLRQGKGASGHEVEIEVLKRRLTSYKTLISKLKSSLSTGQATSLLDPEEESGPTGDTLSARQLHGLASERVLQSVRSIPDGKANPDQQGGASNLGLAHIEDQIIQSSAVTSASAKISKMSEDDESDSTGQSSSREESHWRAIEARKPIVASGSRGGAKLATGATMNGSRSGSPVEEEEVTIGLHLPSESELSSYHRATQNDTDSSYGPVPPPRKGRVTKAVKNFNSNCDINNTLSSGSESSDGHMANQLSRPAALSANKRLFGNEKSLPLLARKNAGTEQWTLQQNQQAPLNRFGEDSFYLPSSAQEGGDSLEDDSEAPPPLPSTGPPGTELPEASLSDSTDYSIGQSLEQKERRDSLDNSTSGMSIRERIAMIEKQLQSDKSGQSDDDQVFYWKKKSSEALRQAEGLERENRYLKEDINRLEKELEEKRRNFHILELWLSNVEDLLKNKNKLTDREILEKLQLDHTKLRRELAQAGYRGEDAILDPAALKTQLERKEREIQSKKKEVEAMRLELKRCKAECENIEDMRRTALDSLRGLERELMSLHDSEKQLRETKDKLKKLQNQYDEMENYKNQAVNMIQPLQTQVERLTHKCQEKDALLKRLGSELRQVSHRPSSALDDLMHLEQVLSAEECNKTQAQGSAARPTAKHRGPTRCSSMDDLDLDYPYSDQDSLEGSFSDSPPKKHRPAPYANSRPRSAEALDPSQRTQRGTHAHSRWAPSGRRVRDHQQLLGEAVTRGQYVAIADYDPGLFSQSGRPGLELSLREGDHVTVSGAMDHSGYYEAVVNGHSGLVPANYLEPLNGHINGLDSQGARLDHSPEQMVDLYRRLQHPHHMAAQPHKGNLPSTRSERINRSLPPAVSTGTTKLPEPPHHLHIKDILSEKSLLLSWLPPPLDNHGNSNGVKVLGYMVFVDNKEYEQISSVGQCEVVIEDLTGDRSHCLAVQSLCAEGYASPRVELVFEGIVHREQDTDLSSVLNNIQYKRGHKKTVMALYDYFPEQQSPQDYTALELAFHAGDLMHVYGEPRQDGFYHGQIGEKRGLVPACFVEDVSKLNKVPGMQKQSSHKSS